MHTAQCKLYIIYCTLHTIHCKLHTAHCKLHTAYCTLPTAHCTLHTAHCTLHTAHMRGEARTRLPLQRLSSQSCAVTRGDGSIQTTELLKAEVVKSHDCAKFSRIGAKFSRICVKFRHLSAKLVQQALFMFLTQSDKEKKNYVFYSLFCTLVQNFN